MGGIGNQMFQYAVGRRLAHFHRTELKLDLSWFDAVAAIKTVRKYELPVFNIQAQVASNGETARYRRTRLLKRFEQLLPISLASRDKRYISEKHYHFDPGILILPDNIYLDGYWQSPRYFDDIKDIIRDEFTIRTEPDAENHLIAEEIMRTESVSIHVRRGDYISDSTTNSIHGVCSLEYYRSAVKMMEQKVKRPFYFVFSDDPRWAEDNLASVCPATFVSHHMPDKPYEDMRLMTLCKHHIIANSSFSWWGAWLSLNSDKVVIAPTHWFRDETVSTRDLIPRQWIRL